MFLIHFREKKDNSIVFLLKMINGGQKHIWPNCFESNKPDHLLDLNYIVSSLYLCWEEKNENAGINALSFTKFRYVLDYIYFIWIKNFKMIHDHYCNIAVN